MKNKFIRWGSINPKKQLGFSNNPDSFHEPPAKKGFYAFPFYEVEYFLLGTSFFNAERMEFVKDERGNLINNEHPLYKQYYEKNFLKYATVYVPEEKRDGFTLGDYWDLLHEKYKDVKSEEEINKFHATRFFIVKVKRPKKFVHNGKIWCHFSPNRGIAPLKQHGSWWMYSNENYNKLLKLRQLENKTKVMFDGIAWSKDDMEVFIEKIEK